MKIYSNGPANIFVQTGLVAAELAGQNVELVYKTPEEAKDKAFLAINMTGKFPLLQLEDGTTINESAAIAQHFARLGEGLYGANAFEAAKCDEWIAFTGCSIWRSLMPVARAVLGHTVVASADFLKAVNELKGHAKTMNAYLAGKTYLVGEKMSVADVVASCALVMAFQTVFDGGFRKGMANVTAWFKRCMENPAFVKHLGHVKCTEKAFKAWDPATAAKAAPAAKKEEAKPAADDDDLDLFGDDNEEDAAAAKAVAEKAKAAKDGAKKKKVVIAMSLVMLEVKPLDDTIDLDALAKKLFSEITQDGLFWKTEYKKEPVAFGIFKLIVGFSLEDEKVSVDDIVERIEGFEELVQSVEIAAFNKI